MVISWLPNVVIKDISQSILFSFIARDVSLRLERRFGEVDSIKLLRVQRDLCLISQNNLSMVDCFTQIKKGFITVPHCTCGVECSSLITVYKLI